MLHKKQTLTVVNRRSVTAFFNRVMENFERKFDGFPAAVGDPESMPAVQEQVDADMAGIELDISDYLSSPTPQCPDTDINPEDCVDGYIPVGTMSERTTAASFWVRDNGDGTHNAGTQSATDVVGYFESAPNLKHWWYGNIPSIYTVSSVNYSTKLVVFSHPVNVWFTSNDSLTPFLQTPSNGLGGAQPNPHPTMNAEPDLVGVTTVVRRSGPLAVYFSVPNSLMPTGWTMRLYPDFEYEKSPCSGQSITEVLTHSGGLLAEFSASAPVDYYVTVWINGIIAVKDEDYIVSNAKKVVLMDGSNLADKEVTARYVVA